MPALLLFNISQWSSQWSFQLALLSIYAVLLCYKFEARRVVYCLLCDFSLLRILTFGSTCILGKSSSIATPWLYWFKQSFILTSFLTKVILYYQLCGINDTSWWWQHRQRTYLSWRHKGLFVMKVALRCRLFTYHQWVVNTCVLLRVCIYVLHERTIKCAHQSLNGKYNQSNVTY